MRRGSSCTPGHRPLSEPATMFGVLEALKDVRVDRKIICPPKWTGTEAERLLLKSEGGSK